MKNLYCNSNRLCSSAHFVFKKGVSTPPEGSDKPKTTMPTTAKQNPDGGVGGAAARLDKVKDAGPPALDKKIDQALKDQAEKASVKSLLAILDILRKAVKAEDKEGRKFQLITARFEIQNAII